MRVGATGAERADGGAPRAFPQAVDDGPLPLAQFALQIEGRAVKAQVGIERLRLDRRYYQAVLQLENLRAELPELQRHAGELSARRAQLEREASAGKPGQIDVEPALRKMVGWLDQYIQDDVPYLQEQRQQRVVGLRGLLEKDNLSDAEKLRAVLEVTQVELQYGRSVETYTGQLRFSGQDQDVEFLRVGRLMLYYLDKDGMRQGYWDRDNRRWQPLPEDEHERIGAAIQMTKGETPPELMELLLPAPEAGS